MIARLYLPIALALVSLAINSVANAGESENLAKVASKLFESEGSKEGSIISFKEGKVISGDKRIHITPVSENVIEKGGKYISAARFEISVDGEKHPELTFGAVGIGDSGADATQTAVIEWYMAAGQALFSAIGRGATDTRIEDLSIYPGLMGIRGERPAGWLDGTPNMNQRIIAALKNHLLSKGGPFSAVDLKILVMADGSIDGQCIIDGKESGVAIADLKKLPWPTTTESYMFKQAYVVARAIN